MYLTSAMLSLMPGAAIDLSSAASPPQMAAVVSPGVISRSDSNEIAPAITPDGRTMFFVRWSGPVWETKQQLFVTRKTEAGWSEPAPVASFDGHRVDWPWVTADGTEILISWCGAYAGKPESRLVSDDFDLWRAPILPDGTVGEPARIAGDSVNLVKTDEVWNIGYMHNETAPQISRDGTMYFWTERSGGVGRRDIYLAEPDGRGGYQTPQALPEPINSGFLDDTFLMDPDEAWIIFSSDRSAPWGDPTLYFSSRDAQGTWSTPVPLPEPLNSAYADSAPVVTDNGRTLLFSSNRPTPDGSDRTANLYSLPVEVLGDRIAPIVRASFAR